jgi:CheY-like chemotaxis protein
MATPTDDPEAEASSRLLRFPHSWTPPIARVLSIEDSPAGLRILATALPEADVEPEPRPASEPRLRRRYTVTVEADGTETIDEVEEWVED